MIKRRKQVRNFLFGFLLMMVLPVYSAQASTVSSHQEMVDRARGASGAGGDEVVPLRSLLDGVGNVFTDINDYFDGGFVSGEPKTENTSEKKSSEPAQIPVKKLDEKASGDKKISGRDAETENVRAKPYRVYSAPMITGVGTDMVAPSAALSGWAQKNSQTIDAGHPVVMDNPSEAMFSTEAEKRMKTKVPPVAALPKQFFPILPLGGGTDADIQLLPVASNVPLDEIHQEVKRAVIVIHDISRDSAESIATLMTLSGVDGSKTLIMAPQFPLSIDLSRFAKHLPDGGAQITRWEIEPGWQFGGETRLRPNQNGISSYMAVDLLMMYLADKNRFPSLQQIVLAGHGSGGDFIQRYAATSPSAAIVGKQRISVHYLVANASSYLYLTGVRPAESGVRFVHPDTKACPRVNMFPYGLDNLSFYARRAGANAIRLDYMRRSITYLVGDQILVDHFLDRACAAMAQGANRTERGRSFARYLERSFGDQGTSSQRFVEVPNAGYDPVALFGSYCGMSVLFGNGECL